MTQTSFRNSKPFIFGLLIVLFNILGISSSHAEENYVEEDNKYTLIERKYFSPTELAKIKSNFDKVSTIQQPITTQNYDYDTGLGTLVIRADILADKNNFTNASNTLLNNPEKFSLKLDLTCNDVASQCQNLQINNAEGLGFYEVVNKKSYYEGTKPFTKPNNQWLNTNASNMIPVFYKQVMIRPNYSAAASINTKLKLELLGSMSNDIAPNTAILLTSYYVQDKNKGYIPPFLNSSKNLNITKGIGFGLVVLTAIGLFATRKQLSHGQALITGSLLAILAMGNMYIWDYNYMIIGMTLIAIAGVMIAFGNALGKIPYLLGAVFIAIIATLKYGAMSKGFFMQTGLLFIIGVGLFFLEIDEATD